MVRRAAPSMRPYLSRLAGSALVFLLGGCQAGTCADFARTATAVAQKSAPCLERSPLPGFDAARCEQNLAACSDADVRQLEAQRACYDALETCQPDQKDAFLQALTTCDSHPLSNPCEAALFQ